MYSFKINYFTYSILPSSSVSTRAFVCFLFFRNATAKVNGVTEVTGKRLFTKRTAIHSINKTVYEIDDSSKKKVDFKPKSVKDNW